MNGTILRSGCAIYTALWLMFPVAARAVEFYVAPGGHDTDPGGKTTPFATLERARDAARQAPGSTVTLSPGTYRLTKPFTLDERDSRTTYRGENARITGSLAIPARAVKPVTELSMVERLLPEVRGKVLAIDLRALGITDFGGIGPRGFGRPYLPSPVELFIDDEPLELSRWPRRGQPGEPIGKVLDDGTRDLAPRQRAHGGTFEYAAKRPARWIRANDLWITGFFNNGYADDTLQVKSIDVARQTLTTVQRHGYGFNSGKPWNRWVALNLIEEIAQPGDCAIDPVAGMLYFLPPTNKPLEQCRIEVSVMKEPLVTLEGASEVVLDGLEIGWSRGVGVYIERGSGNRIQNATLRNLGELAVCIGMVVGPDGKAASPKGGDWRMSGDPLFNRNAGTGHGVIRCRIFNTGAGGISLGGGDRRRLVPAGNYVEQCDIHHFNRWDRTYRGAVNIDGVGNRIRHCLIHDCPGCAIFLHGNEHLIEYNEVHHAILEGDDMGAFYMGRDPTERGIIIRYNYWHDLAPAHSTHCLYFDDSGGDSARVYGNVFRKAGSLSTVNINGGSDIVVTNNIFIDCKKPVRMGKGGNEWRTKNGRFDALVKGIDCDQSPWRERYPELSGYLATRPQMPRGNLFARNLLVNSKLEETKGVELEGNRSVTQDPGRKDVGIPGFEPIPVNNIGP